jgi:outer membrane autotransporter protein
MVSVGGSISYGGTRGDGFQSDIDANEVMGSVFGVLHGSHGYVDLILGAGSSSFDITRVVPIGTNNRHETGNTSASHFAAELGGGLSFGDENFHHGPFASIAWQQVNVRDYQEDSLDSTAMWFDEFDRESTIGRIGYQAEGNAGRLHPFGRIAWAKQNETDPTSITAGSNTMNGHFTFDGFIPSEDWAEAELGLGFQINDRTHMNASYRARLSDDNQDFDALALDFRWEFANAAPAPEPAPVVETTCSDLDDDSDGINNCDDKCPGSTAGEPVGADGCAVPAPEPEPEPKPFRN